MSSNSQETPIPKANSVPKTPTIEEHKVSKTLTIDDSNFSKAAAAEDSNAANAPTVEDTIVTETPIPRDSNVSENPALNASNGPMLTGTVLGYDREERAWIEQDQCPKRIVISLENNTVNTTHVKKGSVVEFCKKEVRGLWWAEVTRLTRPPLTLGALLTGVVVSRYWDPKMRDIA